MKKHILLLLLWGYGPGALAETLDLSLFTVNVPDGWTYSIDRDNSASADWSDTLTMSPANSIGELKMRALTSSSAVDEPALRRMTNLDESIRLDWQNWANFSGYQFSYTENGALYTQWWITNNRAILLATYTAGEQADVDEAESMARVIESIDFPQP